MEKISVPLSKPSDMWENYSRAKNLHNRTEVHNIGNGVYFRKKLPCVICAVDLIALPETHLWKYLKQELNKTNSCNT